jgi:hypothetical protein
VIFASVCSQRGVDSFLKLFIFIICCWCTVLIYSPFLLCMIASRCLYVTVLIENRRWAIRGWSRVLLWWAGSAGTFYQGKYSMGLSLFPIHHNILNSCMHVSPWQGFPRNEYLDSYGILHWVAIVSAQPKPWFCNLTNGAINIKRWFFSNLITGG